MTDEYARLYKHRRFAEGYPDLAHLLATHCVSAQTTESDVARTLSYVNRVADLSTQPRTAAVIGCGARPWAIRDLHASGFTVVGVEPVESSRRAAEDFLGGIGPVLSGVVESLPLDTASMRLILLPSVLEHVDSVRLALSECFRVLMPGGVLYVVTTNRHRFVLSGRNGEYTTRFYNWFPSAVKESYVYKHLHFDPTLANYAVRPAVHWFTYAELCQLGREAGFGQFYSKLDLVDDSIPGVGLSAVKRLVVNSCRHRPWLRAIALSQLGGTIFMLKRP